MNNKIPHYYRIRKCVFWGIITALISLIGIAYFKDNLYDKWLHSQGVEYILFTDMKSSLDDKKNCFLCSHNDSELMGQDSGSMGVLFLNELNIIKFHLADSDKSSGSSHGLSTAFGNNEGISYLSNTFPSIGMASIEITLSKESKLNKDTMQSNLCQDCLDKIAESLSYSKWKKERKEAVPLCLVDFETMEIYSVQDWHKGYMAGNHWVELKPEKEKMEINIFTLLRKDR